MTFASKSKYDADAAIRTFQQAARLNREELHLRGSVLHLPAYGQVVMTGDLHGHERNFEKLQKYAMLDRAPARHVILHELIHADLVARSDVDTSHHLLLKAAQYKCDFPDQVHFLQSNHELAQLTGYLIAKNGRVVIEEFNSAVLAAYGGDPGRSVLHAINEFIASFPLAVRTPNRVWMSHSLPNAQDMDQFDAGIFQRAPTLDDLRGNRSIFNLVWGRRQTPQQLDDLARTLDVDVFLLGHQPQEMGFAVLFDRLIILASNHSHGTFLPFDLSKARRIDDLEVSIRKFVEIA
ncbi:MAG TPA: metallophosphoesterase [Phycisphaerae bacterium]|nr:metallophosphoesterase [Phycisphaerae bacterium]